MEFCVVYFEQLTNKKRSFSLVDNANIIWISWNFLIPSAVHNSLKVLRSQGLLEIFRFKVTYIQKGWHFHHIGFLPDWQLGSKKKLLAFFISLRWPPLSNFRSAHDHRVHHCRTPLVWYISCNSKVVHTNTSCLEAHSGFFRLLMKGKFDAYVLQLFGEKVNFLIINTH